MSHKQMGPQRRFGRTLDTGKTQMGGSLDLLVVKENVLSRRPTDTPMEVCYSWALRVERVCGLTVVHPCRVKSFRKAVSTVMDDLVKCVG